MAQITTEQALQIPQQLQRQGSRSGSDGSTTASNPSNAASSKVLSDETVTLRKLQVTRTLKNVSVESYKSELGQDSTFVKETLRNKLAEYNLNPNIRLTASKDLFGNMEVKGAVLQGDLEKITTDLNKSQAFSDAFSRIQQQQPTLDYVDNVVKLSNTYGVSNALFNSIVSEDEAFNGLNDIAHRYQALKGGAESYDGNSQAGERFQFIVN